MISKCQFVTHTTIDYKQGKGLPVETHQRQALCRLNLYISQRPIRPALERSTTI